MRYSQLRAFHAVALHGGFSRAAEALNQTQPALSEQVRRLEQDHDTLLFHRDRRQVRLTEAGEQLFLLTKRFFDAEASIADHLSRSRAALTGRLRIVADSARHITPVLARFREKAPDVLVSVETGNTDTVLARLRNYDAEIGVLGSLGQAPDLISVDLGDSPIVAIAGRDTPWAGEGLRLSDLRRLPLVMREKGSRTRQQLEEAARAAGIRLSPSVEVDGREAMREVVASGAGIGFISRAEMGEDQRLVPLPLIDVDLRMPETLVCLSMRADQPMIRAFIRAARNS